MRNWLLYFVILGCVLLSGCRLIHIDEQKKPEVTQQEVEMAMSQFLPKDSTPIPFSVPKSQTIVRDDLDGDGVSEGIVIYPHPQQTGKFEMLVIKRNQKRQWEKWNQFSIQAKKLLNVELRDVTKDKRSELILSMPGEKAKSERLLIYQLQANRVRTLLNRPYDEKVIYDFQRDGTNEVVLFQILRDSKRKTVHTKAELFDYRGNALVVIDRIQLEGEANKGDIHYGKVSSNTRGIFVDLAVGSRGGGTTVLLVPKKSVLLQKIEPGKGLYSYKLLNEASRDVNGDGIIEFVLMEQPKGTEKMPSSNLPYVYNWYQWVKGDNRKLVQQVYEDLNLGFRFQYFARWLGNIKIEAHPQSNQVTFYYGKVNQPIKKEWKLFTLRRFNQNEWNKLIQAGNKPNPSTQPFIVKKKGAFIYAAILPTPQERAQLQKIKQQHLIPTKEELTKHFILLSPQEQKSKLALRAKIMPKTSGQ